MSTPTSVSILGATGSIGNSTLKLLRCHPERFRLHAVTAHRNVAALATLARAHGARFAAIADARCYHALKEALSGTDITAAAGPQGLQEAAAYGADVVVAAIVGIAGLAPTLTALRSGARIALANKECLVAAGAFFMAQAKTHRATLIPVDSEHNAVFQLLHPDALRITLTASGGPFRTFTREAMATVTPAQACTHPTWNMGAKISVDSATLMNKGLEIIEAHYLFSLPSAQIDVVVHPESIVHALVHFADGSVLAHLSSPDMATPLAHALSYPTRIPAPVAPLALTSLSFFAPDTERFPALRLSREALASGPAAMLTLNAANEIAVEAFLAGRIPFLAITEAVEAALAHPPSGPMDSLEAVLAADAAVRTSTLERLPH